MQNEQFICVITNTKTPNKIIKNFKLLCHFKLS